MHMIDRRRFLVAGALGLAATACAAPSEPRPAPSAAGGAKTTGNPLGVTAAAALDVVIFKGGYGDAYATNAEGLYQQRFPQAKISHQGIQKLRETLQARFVAGNPPDVVDNTGPSALNITALVKEGQLTDLAPLLAAPSLDDPGKPVKDTLLPGVVDAGTFDGKVLALNYAYTVYGFWYNKALFASKGWQYPKTWADLLTLAEEIKKAGLAPFTYQGKYPSYFIDPLMAMIEKAGGHEAVIAIDNLEPNAWQSDAVKASAAAIGELAVRGHILKGSEGLSHTEAQQAWLDGKAALIPSGSWLENEMKSTTPAGFSMAVGPTPSVTVSDRLPFTALQASSSESFIVPVRGKNAAGGMEFLRIMLSKAAAGKFSELTGSLTTVVGAGQNVTDSPALTSAREAVAAAGTDTTGFRFAGWYGDLYNDASTAMGELLAGRIKPEEFITRTQRSADKVAKDSNVQKFRR